jgi:hypothetical protein
VSISYQIGNVEADRRSIDKAAARFEHLINDLRRTEAALMENIGAEEHHTRRHDPSDPHYSMLARSMRSRLDNLRATIAKLEAERQGLAIAA